MARVYAGMLRDKKYNKVECVRECELSCRRIRFGEGLSGKGLRFVVVKKMMNMGEDNQRIDYGFNHFVIKKEKSLTIMIRECIWEIGRNA
ncbi:hypothetical protein Tco_0624929 [Tanacetum coccineum]|uniref:Uncharacterized protein n=1 Tax=Tanacetum coccineum TaxID=301880 RepID=A0ABQ4WFF1_9ASTR